MPTASTGSRIHKAHLKKNEGPFARAPRIAGAKQHPLREAFSSQTTANPPLLLEDRKCLREDCVDRMTSIRASGISSASSTPSLKTLIFSNGENTALRAGGGDNSGRKQGPTNSDMHLPAPFQHHPLRCQIPVSFRVRPPVRLGAIGCAPPLSITRVEP